MSRLAREELTWTKPFTQVLDESNAPFYKWFHDGELNASYNCLDKNLENGNADGSKRLIAKQRMEKLVSDGKVKD